MARRYATNPLKVRGKRHEYGQQRMTRWLAKEGSRVATRVTLWSKKALRYGRVDLGG